MIPGVLTGGLPLKMPSGPGEERGVVDGPRNVELPGQLQRLPALERLRPGEVLGALGELGGEPVQGVGPLTGSEGRPARKGRTRRGDGGVHILDARQLVGEDLFPTRGIHDRVRTTGGPLGEAPSDELRAFGEPLLGREPVRGGTARLVHVALLRRHPGFSGWVA